MLFATLVGFASDSVNQPISNTPVSFEVNELAAADFAREVIRNITSASGADCVWNNTTDICASVALYNSDDVCIGYVFKLSTDGEPTGYIQVNNINNELVVYCFSLNGIPAYEGLTAGLDVSFDPSAEKLYFFGNFNYCTKLINGNFSPLDSPEEFSSQEVAAYYNNFLDKAEQCKEECSIEDEKNDSKEEK